MGPLKKQDQGRGKKKKMSTWVGVGKTRPDEEGGGEGPQRFDTEKRGKEWSSKRKKTKTNTNLGGVRGGRVD